MGKQWKQWETSFLGGSKITADGIIRVELLENVSCPAGLAAPDLQDYLAGQGVALSPSWG